MTEYRIPLLELVLTMADAVDLAIRNRADLDRVRRVSQAAADKEYRTTMLRA